MVYNEPLFISGIYGNIGKRFHFFMPAGTRALRLVFEVADAGDDHGHVVVLAEVDAVLVVDGAAGVDDACDAGLVGYLDAVGEGEE